MIKYFFIILLLFVVDRFTKIYIMNLPAGRQEILNLGGFFDLHINQQIAFSLPVTYLVLYPIIIAILVVLFIFWKKDFDKKSILIWPWALVIVGAISNLLDRISYGGVIDFITVPYFTVFNLSDVYISVGVIWILWYYWFYGKNKQNNKAA